MKEFLWYALSHGVTRPVLGQDVPLWFAALLVLLGSRGVLVSLPLHGGVLSQARSRHGALLVAIGNRDF